MNLFLVCVVVSVVCCLGISGILFSKKNLIEIVILAICCFFCSYIAGTMILFVLDQYSLFRGIAITAGLNFLVFIISFLICKKNLNFDFKSSLDFNSGKILIPILVSAIGLLFVSQKNEIFGMGQDEGVYQIVAINFLNGLDERQQDFAEYHTLETQEQRENFQKAVCLKLVGYDIPEEDYPDCSYDREISEVSGIYHGIPTYAAMLALWGKLFGMAHMAEIQNLFYLLMIFLIYFVCEHLKLKPVSILTACVTAALSPIVIWVGKSTLTELFLAVILLLFLYFLTDSGNPGFSIIPVIVFGCYHVSIYTLIPYIIMIYAGLYFFTQKKIFAGLLLSTPPVYLASYFAMRQVQPYYTMNNYRVVFGNGMNVDNITQVIPVVCGILEILCIGYVLLIRKISIRKEIVLNPDSKTLKWLLIVMTALPLLYIIYQTTAKLETVEESISLTILGFVQNAGAALLPVGVIFLFTRTRIFLENLEKLVIFVSFFYCILIYSGFLRFQIDYYDYYARYLVPFVPIAVIFTAIALDQAGRKTIYPLLILSLCFALPYDDFLRTHRDDTRMEWEILEDITSHITENDCVVIEDTYLFTLWLPVRAITGATVYPAENDLMEQLERLSGDCENLYFITGKSYTHDTDYNLELIYTDMIQQMEDLDNHPESGMPRQFEAVSKQIFCYAWLQDCLEYPASTIHHFQIYGIDKYEGTFCWTNAEYAAIQCILAQEDYTLTVNLAGMIPLGAMEPPEFPVELSVNGRIVAEQSITEETNGQSLIFEIPADVLRDGSNIFGFHTPVWDSSMIHPKDGRILGIPLESLQFTVQESQKEQKELEKISENQENPENRERTESYEINYPDSVLQ